MHIAIFGGSFDPVHTAHVAIVNEALNSLNIDKIVVVPTYLNPFKSNYHLEPEQRKYLIEKVFKDTKNVEISDYEINQQKAVYSIETVKYLKNLYKPSKIYIIIGEDNLEYLHKWHKIDELKSLAEFVVATRAGYKDSKLDKFQKLYVDIEISSTKLRNKIDFNYIPIQIKKDLEIFKK